MIIASGIIGTYDRNGVVRMGIAFEYDPGFRFRYRHGERDLITDVPGVLVGHVTYKDGDINTGVTAVLPHAGNIFRDKVFAGAEVLNGFGKSIGLIQINELGTIETPIILTNTLNVGTAFTGLCRYMLEQNEDIGVTTGTVNCVITECNDGGLNDIRGLHVRESDVGEAIANAAEIFDEGAVGGGTGMRCLGLKGGIGSASRIVEIEGAAYTVGALVMANFGAAGNLVINGHHYDTTKAKECILKEKDKGSIIMLIATDVPLSERQLRRTAKRSAISLGRTGSYMGNGSGDIAIAFSTANRVPHDPEHAVIQTRMLHDDEIDSVFEAACEAVEESIVSALWHAETTRGVRGNIAVGLQDFLKMYE